MSVSELHDRICHLWRTNSYGVYDLQDTRGRVLKIINDREDIPEDSPQRKTEHTTLTLMTNHGIFGEFHFVPYNGESSVRNFLESYIPTYTLNEIKTMEKRIQDFDEENNWEEEEETIEELREENQQLRLRMQSLDDLISQCEPSIRNYLRGRNWRVPEDEENDCEDAPKSIQQLWEENQQLRLNKRSLENRISQCEPSIRNFLFG